MEASILFPHQLFEDNPILQKDRIVYLIEEYLFFNQYNFHKQKLAFHRASIKCYESHLKNKGLEVTYIEASDPLSDIRKFISKLAIKKLYAIDPVDNYLTRRLKTTCKQQSIQLIIFDSPSFLNTKEALSHFFSANKKKFFQTEFYIQQRKKWNVLLEEGEKPQGGKWKV